jgi:hypothetical protein
MRVDGCVGKNITPSPSHLVIHLPSYPITLRCRPFAAIAHPIDAPGAGACALQPVKIVLFKPQS